MDEVALLTLKNEIIELEQTLSAKKRQLEELQSAGNVNVNDPTKQGLLSENEANNKSSPETKIALFHSLFWGREDIYAKRFENKKTG